MLLPLSDVLANITLAHCDAVGRGHPLHQLSAEINTETTEAAFDEMHRVLFKGDYFMTQGLLASLRDGAAVVNVASSATRPTSISPGYSAYASMKGAITTLTRYMAKEFAPRGIRVNSVAPGPTRTRLGGDAFARFSEIIPAIAADTALG